MQCEPSETQAVRESVTLLVARHGVAGAERELQRRFRGGDDPERALAGLAYLRQEYTDQ